MNATNRRRLEFAPAGVSFTPSWNRGTNGCRFRRFASAVYRFWASSVKGRCTPLSNIHSVAWDRMNPRFVVAREDPPRLGPDLRESLCRGRSLHAGSLNSGKRIPRHSRKSMTCKPQGLPIRACEARLSCCWLKAQNARGPGTESPVLVYRMPTIVAIPCRVFSLQAEAYPSWNLPWIMIASPSTVMLGFFRTPSTWVLLSHLAPVLLGYELPKAMWMPGNFSSCSRL